MSEKFPQIREYYINSSIPVYTEYRANQTVQKIPYLSPEQKKHLIKQESDLLDKFTQIMCSQQINHRQAEKQVYPESPAFYKEYFKTGRTIAKEQQEEELAKQKEAEKVFEKKGRVRGRYTARMTENIYLEKDISREQCDKLLGRGYKRIKISPYGDSGAAFYWVKTRFNESKEHAFFCYLIEAELKQHTNKITLNVTNGADIEFDHKWNHYCFEVETGKIMARSPRFLERKFEHYRKEQREVYILVTSKALKYKYAKYGKVITRATLRKTISSIFKER